MFRKQPPPPPPSSRIGKWALVVFGASMATLLGIAKRSKKNVDTDE
jgi:hypothetical protein